MEIVFDNQQNPVTVSDAGFSTYLQREISPIISPIPESRYTDASNLVGGIIGSEGIIYLGSKEIKLDGKNRRMVLMYEGKESIIFQDGAIKLLDSSGNVSITLENAAIRLSDGTNIRTTISDGAIVVNDGTNDRVLIGYQSGGF